MPRVYKPRINIGAQARCSSSVTFDWYIITPITRRERETQACGPKLNDGRGVGGGFLLETVNLISQHSSRNRKSNSVRAALSISCLAAQVDKCTAELIYSAYILDALMLIFVFFCFFLTTVAHLFFWLFLWSKWLDVWYILGPFLLKCIILPNKFCLFRFFFLFNLSFLVS